MPDFSLRPAFSVRKAHGAQASLSKHIIFEDKIPKKIRLIGGVDVAYVQEVSIAAVAVLDFDNLEPKESQTAFCKTSFPYIPTLLSFRETPPAVHCIRKLCLRPDVFLVDGHGYSHPYRCGFASHLGLVIGKPTIGVAKGILVGEVDTSRAGSDFAFIRDKGEVIGVQINPKPGLKPIYVSVGHMISLKTAVKIVKHCIVHDRIPEPLLQAHKIATAEKGKINISRQAQTSNK